MLLLTGGEERTEDEYAELLARAGFRLERVIPTRSPVSVLEAVPVCRPSVAGPRTGCSRWNAMSADAVIGREEELGEIRASLTASADGPAAPGAGR